MKITIVSSWYSSIYNVPVIDSADKLHDGCYVQDDKVVEEMLDEKYAEILKNAEIVYDYETHKHTNKLKNIIKTRKLLEEYSVTPIPTTYTSEARPKNFGIHPKTACLYGKNEEDIRHGFFRIVATNPSKEDSKRYEDEGKFFGYVDEDGLATTMVQPSYMLLSIQFAYGVDCQVKHKEGVVVVLELTEAV